MQQVSGAVQRAGALHLLLQQLCLSIRPHCNGNHTMGQGTQQASQHAVIVHAEAEASRSSATRPYSIQLHCIPVYLLILSLHAIHPPLTRIYGLFMAQISL
jgi:hypothetical protein